MATSVPMEIITAAIGFGGAVVGYAFREYRNRIRPFFQVTEIDGGITRWKDRITVDQDISQTFENTFYIKPISKKCRFGDFYDCWYRADDLKVIWPHTRTSVDAVIEAASDDEMRTALLECFRNRKFKEWMVDLLKMNRLSFQEIPQEEQEKKIHIYDSNEYEGTTLCDFGIETVTFGRKLSNPATRAKVDPWLDAVCFLHHGSIKNALREYKQVLEYEYQCALQHVDAMKKKVNEHSRWCFTCFLANLSGTPLVVENKASVVILDSTGVQYNEPCYIVLIKRGEGAKKTYVDTLTPLVIKGGFDEEFAVITDNIQSDMKLGTAIREAYERGEGTFQLELRIRKVGLIKRQKYKSPAAPFASMKKVEK